MVKDRIRVLNPIRLRKSTKIELREVGEYLKRRVRYNSLSYDEIITLLLIDFRQKRNRGGSL